MVERQYKTPLNVRNACNAYLGRIKSDPERLAAHREKCNNYVKAYTQKKIEKKLNETAVNPKDGVTYTLDDLTFINEMFDYSDSKVFTPTSAVYEKVKSKYPALTRQKIKSFLLNKMGLVYAQKYIDERNVRGYRGVSIIN